MKDDVYLMLAASAFGGIAGLIGGRLAWRLDYQRFLAIVRDNIRQGIEAAEHGTVIEATERHPKSRKIRSLPDFEQAEALAVEHGFVLKQCSEHQYQLRFESGGITNLYPLVCKVYNDPRRPGPKLTLPMPWTLTDAVKAAAEGGPHE